MFEKATLEEYLGRALLAADKGGIDASMDLQDVLMRAQYKVGLLIRQKQAEEWQRLEENDELGFTVKVTNGTA